MTWRLLDTLRGMRDATWSLARGTARREPRYLEAKGIAGEIVEARLTWKRRSKKRRANA